MLQFLRATEAGDPYAFRFEPQNYILPTAGGGSPNTRFDWNPEMLADLHAVRLSGCDPAVVQRVGERLRRFVEFAGWVQIERDIAQALASQRPVFLTIRSSAAELYALPWELLTLESGQFIGEVDGLLLRFEWPEKSSAQEQPAPRPEGGRILFAWSAAAGAVPAAEHLQAIHAACAAGFHPFNPDTDVLAHASLGRIAKTLEEARRNGPPIAVLHLLCHGGAIGSTFGLCLDGDSGPVVVDAAQVRQQLAPFASMVRLVVLSACDSGNSGALGNHLGSLAQTLHRCGYQAVVASRFPLSVAGSITLTETLYGELLSGPAALETALLAARNRLLRDETSLPGERRRLDWASVQLYARHDDGDDTRPVVFRPFRGLLTFQPEHRRFFFGRDREVEEVLHALQGLIARRKVRFLVVAGASGTGKSSLVLAGVVPRFLEKNPELLMLKMRPGSEPERALNEVLSASPPGRRGLLVVDQFEEVFSQTDSAKLRVAFLRRLWSLASAPEPGLTIIVTLRVDFIGRCGEVVLDEEGLRLDRIAYDEAHRVFVPQLDPKQLWMAIVEPARKVGLELQAGLAERMIDDVGCEPGALPLLEDVLDVLWQQRSGRTLTQRAYIGLGGVVGALQKRADEFLVRLLPAERAAARLLFMSLVAVAEDTALDTRRRVPLAELRQSFTGDEAPGFERVLKELVEARLLVLDEDKHGPSVEVAHEALIRKWAQLRLWLDEDREALLMHYRIKQRAREWEFHVADPRWGRESRDESLLFRGAQLAQALAWLQTWGSRVGDVERRFLHASAELRDRAEKEQAKQKKREQDAVERIKQKSIEARDALLVAIAQTLKDDPVAAVNLLREVVAPDSRWWRQTAIEALQADIPEVILRGSEVGICSVAISQDGTKIVSSVETIARVWSSDGTGEPVLLRGHEAPIHSVAFSPDGTKIVSGAADMTARIWNADGTGAPVVLRGHSSRVDSVAFSPMGRTVATGSADMTARIWNADGSGTPTVLEGHQAELTSVTFSPDGTTLLTGSTDNTVRLWQALQAGFPALVREQESSVTAVAFSPDGTKIATGSADNVVRIANVDGSGASLLFRGHKETVTSVAFSPDGTKIVSGSDDTTVRVWRIDGFGEPTVFHGHAYGVTSVTFSPDGTRIATGSWDGIARIFRVVKRQASLVLRSSEHVIDSIAFSPDGSKVFTLCYGRGIQTRSSDGSGDSVTLPGCGSAERLSAFNLSPDGTKVATGSWDHTACVWNVDGTGIPVVLRGHESRVCSVAFSPDGKRIVTGSNDHTARVWNVDGTGTPVVLSGHGSGVDSVAFSPDGMQIVTGSEDRTARIWSADGSGNPVVLVHESGVRSVALAFTPNGKKIVTGSGDNLVRVWMADGSGSPLLLQGHESEVRSVAFSPDGMKLATASGDGTARIWNTYGAGGPVILKGHASGVDAVAFSHDGRKIATASTDKTIRIWTIASDALLEMLWSATTDCLSVERRQELILESRAEAEEGYQRCQQELARRRSASSIR